MLHVLQMKMVYNTLSLGGVPLLSAFKVSLMRISETIHIAMLLKDNIICMF